MLTFFFFLVILILLLINIHTSHSILCLRGCLPLTTPPYSFQEQRLPSRRLLPLKQFQSTWPAKSRHKRALWFTIRARVGAGGKKNRMTFHCKLWDTARGFHSTHTHNSNPAQVGPRGARRGRPRNTIPSDSDDSSPSRIFGNWFIV